MWVSLDFPEPHGSIRYWESITTARTPPISWASSCSTDRDTRVHIPLGKSVFQVLEPNKPCFRVVARETGDPAHTAKFTLKVCLSQTWAIVPMLSTWIKPMVTMSLCEVYKVRFKGWTSAQRVEAPRPGFGTPNGSAILVLKRPLPVIKRLPFRISTYSLKCSVCLLSTSMGWAREAMKDMKMHTALEERQASLRRALKTAWEVQCASVQSWDQDGAKEESREGFLEEVMKALANTGSADPRNWSCVILIAYFR